MPKPWNQGVRGTQVLPLINLDAETLRVESGPGTGKTFGLVRRVERILHPDGLDVSGKDVLIVAFNRVIAKQLRSEVEKRIKSSKERPGPAVWTIHGLCVQLVGRDVRLLLPHEREAMLYDVMHAFPPLKKRYKTRKKADIALLEHEARNADHHELWQAVNLWLGRHNARLVSDLPGLVLDKMKGGDLANEGYLHVIVDEFQDLTPSEQALVFGLRVEGGQLVALGDPRQSIYRFRGNDPEGLDKLDDLAEEWGDGQVIDVVMTECQRCPAPIVRAANRLMSLSTAKAMVPVSTTTANLHVVHWPSPADEAAGMARFIVENQKAHPDDDHLVMVTRRQFGYALRDQIAAIDKDIRVDLAFSEGLLETWAVREAFLLFCLLLDPDRPTWRAWLAYENSTTGRGYKAAQRNAGAYLKLLEAANDKITSLTMEALVKEPREQRRGAGGTILWDRAKRFLKLRKEFEWDTDNPAGMLLDTFDADRWIGPDTVDAETARLDMGLLLDRAMSLFADAQERKPKKSSTEQLRMVAAGLRQHIATREPFETEAEFDIQVATLWGAKGVTADHVYILGACDEAIPGGRRDEYPGTDTDFVEEQRRLFYVSITRAKRTLVLSRATEVTRGEALRLGLAVDDPPPFRIDLEMTRFLRDVLPLLPKSVAGERWAGCVAHNS